MPRRRRYIESGGVYEICFRAREGIPFPCLKVIELLIKSALARTQRDCKVLIGHFLWMGNHAHILVVVQDALQFIRFYGELQKRLTDSLKRLLGLEYLDLWEGRPAVIRIADLDAAIERLVYFYTNPSKANLVDSIEQYPGYSTWRQFLAVKPKLGARIVERTPWIRLPSIHKAPRHTLSEVQDRALVVRLRSASKITERLNILPNAWMRCFGVTDTKEIKRINESIQSMILEKEAKYRAERLAQGKRLFGVTKLKKEPIMRSHMPKKKERKIFVIARDKLARLEFIKFFNVVCEQCRECYELWVEKSTFVPWPPGTFRPPLPPLANALAA